MRSDIWENLIALNNHENPEFQVLDRASAYQASDSHGTDWAAEKLDIDGAIKIDDGPLPTTADREGYYGPHHFSFWASGLRDMRNLLACTGKYGVKVNDYFDFGCASARVIRHIAYQRKDIRTFGADINRRHVEWCNRYMPRDVVVFQNHSVPSLPFPDASLDLISAFSVFSHIEAFESAWLMELRRVLRPGGIAWLTVHTERTLEQLDETWPIYNALKTHEDYVNLKDKRKMTHDRMVFRWLTDRSYSSNVFYSSEYIKSSWGRILDVVDMHPCSPPYQDAVVLRKRV